MTAANGRPVPFEPSASPTVMPSNTGLHLPTRPFSKTYTLEAAIAAMTAAANPGSI
jgi:hypothetical protein